MREVETVVHEQLAGPVLGQERRTGLLATPLDPGSRRVALALALLVLVVLGPFVQKVTAQSGSRYAFLGAAIDERTIDLTGYERYLGGDDFVVVDANPRTDKAPGQLLLGIPAYATARAVGAEPATVVRYDENLGAWWVTWWTSVVPTAVLAALMFATARRRIPTTALAAAVGLSFGTIVVAFGSQMYSHGLSALLGFGAWVVLERGPLRARRLLVTGALGGAAVATEYTLGLVVLALVAWALWRGAGARVAWMALGVLPAGVVLALYHQVSYGHPLRTSYSMKDSLEGASVVGGMDPSTGLQVLLGSRGLLVLTPVVLCAVIGAVQLARRPGPHRAASVLGLGLLGAFTAFQAGWPNPWGGEMPGPRYLIPVLPFLVLPLAHVWVRHARICLAATAVGFLVMGLAVVTFHLVPQGASVLQTYAARAANGPWTPTIFTMAFGGLGWAVSLAVTTGAVALLVRLRRVDLIAVDR